MRKYLKNSLSWRKHDQSINIYGWGKQYWFIHQLTNEMHNMMLQGGNFEADKRSSTDDSRFLITSV